MWHAITRLASRTWHRWREIRNNWSDYPLQEGTVWGGQYEVLRFLGMGSYGQAYVCLDQRSGATVLLKRNKPSKRMLGIQLLQRERDVMQALSHEQIPRLIAYRSSGSEEAIAMDYVEGHNLEYIIYEQGGSFTVQEAMQVLKGLLQPLKHLHDSGYVHRDVRIPNVLIREGKPYLIDYGLACRIGEELPGPLKEALGETDVPADSAAALKTRMRRAHPASDWFGLGHLFLFLMYAGYTPPKDGMERSWEEELELPDAVQLFLRKLLNEDQGWPCTAECERELDELLKRGDCD